MSQGPLVTSQEFIEYIINELNGDFFEERGDFKTYKIPNQWRKIEINLASEHIPWQAINGNLRKVNINSKKFKEWLKASKMEKEA